MRNLNRVLFGTMLLLFANHLYAAKRVVKDGESIQEAVTKATPGDVIEIFPGTYKETVFIDKDDITLSGVVVGGEWAVLEGEKIRNDAILYSGNGITIENLKIVNYKGNAIMGQAGNNYIIRDNWIIDTGVYGIFPQLGKNGLIERNVLSGIEDAAIYVGMCDNVDVRNNEVFDSVAGIEIENSRYAIVENNYVHDNTGGILTFITPGLPIKTAHDIIIRNNFVVNNNHVNFAIPGSIVSFVPQGTGIIVMAADDVVIENNIITGNQNAGITIAGLDFIASAASDPDSEPNPDRLKILNNQMWGNGGKPSLETTALLKSVGAPLVGPDIANIATTKGSCIHNSSRYRTLGLDAFDECKAGESSKDIVTYTLSEPVKPRVVAAGEKGRAVYFGVCAGCHAYNARLIGPATISIQALYQGNAKGIADYIESPVRRRQDYPEMPPQNYLSEEVRLEVAKYLLSLEK